VFFILIKAGDEMLIEHSNMHHKMTFTDRLNSIKAAFTGMPSIPNVNGKGIFANVW
jgi:hypothetical protein